MKDVEDRPIRHLRLQPYDFFFTKHGFGCLYRTPFFQEAWSPILTHLSVTSVRAIAHDETATQPCGHGKHPRLSESASKSEGHFADRIRGRLLRFDLGYGHFAHRGQHG